MVRHVRDEEIIAQAIRQTRRGLRDAQRPTGTERALTTEAARNALEQSEYAKELAEALQAELGPLPGQVQDALDEAARALVEAGLARSDAAAAVADAQAAVAEAAQAIADALAASEAADAAQVAADSAQTAAGEAQGAAADAAQEALQAATAASAADAKATGAAATAAIADSKAGAAQAAAGSAQSAATAAQATADSKGKTLIQSAAPAAADRLPQNLWIDTTGGANTPKRWSGTAWVAVTDKAAVDAANAAVAAQSRADAAFAQAVTAANAAGQAQVSADGKSRVWYQGTKPAGTGHKVDDTWFDTANAMRMSRWDGTDWAVRKFGTAAIQELSITNALIADAAIESAKIANLDAGKITSGVIAAARIAALSISTDKLAAEAVTAAKIAALTITAAQLAANAVTAVKIAAGAVTAEKISAGAVTTDKLDALSVTAAKIASGAIIADKIAAGAITTAKLAATAIDGMTITGAFLEGGIIRQRGTAPAGTKTVYTLPEQVTRWANRRMIIPLTESGGWGPTVQPPAAVSSTAIAYGATVNEGGTFRNQTVIDVPPRFPTDARIRASVWVCSFGVAQTIRATWPDGTTQNHVLQANVWTKLTRLCATNNGKIRLSEQVHSFPTPVTRLASADAEFEAPDGFLAGSRLAVDAGIPVLEFYSGGAEQTLKRLGAVSPEGVDVGGVVVGDGGVVVGDGGGVTSAGTVAVAGKVVQLVGSAGIDIGSWGGTAPTRFLSPVEFRDDEGPSPLPGVPARPPGGLGCAYEVRAGQVTIWINISGTQAAGINDFWSGLDDALCPTRNVFGAVLFDQGYTATAFVRPNGTMGCANQSGGSRIGLQTTFTYPLKS